MDEIVTMDLSKFGYRELQMAKELLDAYMEQGVPNDFNEEGLQICFNTHSGCVFLTNEEYDVLMMNEDKLERFYTLPWSGEEGFADDLRQLDLSELNEEDIEYMVDNGIIDKEDEE